MNIQDFKLKISAPQQTAINRRPLYNPSNLTSY